MIKKVIAMNIMDGAVFLLFVAIGYTHGGQAPIIREGTGGCNLCQTHCRAR
jgi:multisubunit Na+/H+ antiporter MnhC subunit